MTGSPRILVATFPGPAADQAVESVGMGTAARMAGRGSALASTSFCWHARSDAASSLVVGFGVIGNLLGYPLLDPIAALIVGLMVAKMGWQFGWSALHDLTDRAADEQEVDAIRRTLLDTPGVNGVHDVRTRKMGDMIVADAHLEIDGSITVESGHDIAVEARKRVLGRHRALQQHLAAEKACASGHGTRGGMARNVRTIPPSLRSMQVPASASRFQRRNAVVSSLVRRIPQRTQSAILGAYQLAA